MDYVTSMMIMLELMTLTIGGELFKESFSQILAKNED